MTQKNILTKNNIPKNCLDKKIARKLSQNFNKIFNRIIDDTNCAKETLNLLNNNFKFNLNLKDLNRFKKFKTLVFIGMGGSILGAKAMRGFLKEKINKNIYFFDNLDSRKNLIFLKKNKMNKILYVVISKSGNTIETLSNFLSINIIKKNQKNVIVISEKKDNALFLISKKFNLFYVEHKSYISGRYSVLSEVGIIPAYLMGLNIFKLRKNLNTFLKGKSKLFLKDSALILSNLLLKKK